MDDEIKTIELLFYGYETPCRAKNCEARATIIARSIGTGGRPDKQYELCGTHAKQVIKREQAKGRKIVKRG